MLVPPLDSWLWHNINIRCRDSTEAGTQFSSILCGGCRSPAPPGQTPSGDWSWRCVSCGRETPRHLVENMINRLDLDRDNIQELDQLEELLVR